MNSILERHDKNAVIHTNSNDISVKIPMDRSILSIFNGVTSIEDGDDYVQEPYYIINSRTGKKRKILVRGNSWDSGRNEILVWEKLIRDSSLIPKIESRYFEISQKVKKFSEEKYLPIVKAIEKVGGKAHAQISHKHEGNQNWWLFDIDKNGVRFDWVDKTENPINLELGQKLYLIQRRLFEMYSREGKIYDVLLRVLQLKSIPLRNENINVVIFKINNRSYSLNLNSHSPYFIEHTIINL